MKMTPELQGVGRQGAKTLTFHAEEHNAATFAKCKCKSAATKADIAERYQQLSGDDCDSDEELEPVGQDCGGREVLPQVAGVSLQNVTTPDSKRQPTASPTTTRPMPIQSHASLCVGRCRSHCPGFGGKRTLQGTYFGADSDVIRKYPLTEALPGGNWVVNGGD